MTGDSNGQAPGSDARAWARFGDLPNQVLHPDTVDAMLRIWRERHPYQFGTVLAEAMTGQRIARSHHRAAAP